jgi:hypothetical protein
MDGAASELSSWTMKTALKLDEASPKMRRAVETMLEVMREREDWPLRISPGYGVASVQQVETVRHHREKAPECQQDMKRAKAQRIDDVAEIDLGHLFPASQVVFSLPVRGSDIRSIATQWGKSLEPRTRRRQSGASNVGYWAQKRTERGRRQYERPTTGSGAAPPCGSACNPKTSNTMNVASKTKPVQSAGGVLHSNRVSSNRSLYFRETEFCAQR